MFHSAIITIVWFTKTLLVGKTCFTLQIAIDVADIKRGIFTFSAVIMPKLFFTIFYFSLTNHEVINLYKVICTETILCFCSFVIKLVSGTVCSVSATSLAICVANTSFFLSIHYLLFLSHNKFRIINVIKKDFMWEFEF